MPIRPVGPADAPHLVDLLRQMHEESPVVSKFAFDAEGSYDVIEDLSQGEKDDLFFWIYIDGGEIAGVALLEASPSLFGFYTVVAEHLLYARPSARGSFGMGRLMQHALRWAENRGDVIRFEASSGIGDDQLAAQAFKRLGLRPSGTLYGKEMV